MSEPASIRTERLLLRPWREADLAAYAAMNADPQVMEHFPAPMTAEQTAIAWERHRAADAAEPEGPRLYALEVVATRDFVGFTGLAVPRFEAAFTPCVEIGWRLARPAWGHGYATEAARAVLRHAFEDLGLEELVSFTARSNLRSQAVMRRLGMHTDPAEDFEHPSVPPASPVRHHVLYRLAAEEWRRGPTLAP